MEFQFPTAGCYLKEQVDLDRAKAFYVDQLGFHAELDIRPNDSVRIVQLTPPGSACSIVLSTGLPAIQMAPGSLQGLHLVVGDVAAARRELIERSVAMGEIEEHDQGVKYADPILMDFGIINVTSPLNPSFGVPSYKSFESARYAMGDTLRFAARMQLIKMKPRSDLSSTGYAKAAQR